MSRPSAFVFGKSTVPQALMGCWRRNWIRFGDDGEFERDERVIWLQTSSGMGDIRLNPAHAPEATNSSCGVTMVDETTTPLVTADWIDGDTGFAQQAESNFPEKGWLDWASPTIMRELAPSGAYVEQWEKLPGSAGLVAHFTATSGPTRRNLYVAGTHVIHARERQGAEALHEFSYGVRPTPTTNDLATDDPAGDDVTIELSTIASLQGQQMILDADWQLVSRRHI